MLENQIKVNSIEELVNKAKEFVASHGETKIGSSVVNSGTYVYRNGKSIQDTKGYVEIELKGGDNTLIKLVLEAAEFNENPCEDTELYHKVVQELNKIGIYHHHRKPEEPKPLKKNEDNDNRFKKREYSEENIDCKTIQQVKDNIKKYYEKNKEEIDKNPFFSYWISVDKVKFLVSYSEVDKNGNQTDKGPFNEFSISLKETFKSSKNEEVGEKIIINYREKDSKNPEEIDEFIKKDWPWEELENYWNGLVGKKIAPDKIAKNEIAQLRQEIKELESNPQINNNLKKKKELTEKRKRLNKLERNQDDNTSKQPDNSNLALYLSIGGVILLVSGIFLVKLVQKRKKIKK